MHVPNRPVLVTPEQRECIGISYVSYAMIVSSLVKVFIGVLHHVEHSRTGWTKLPALLVFPRLIPTPW